MIVPCIKCGRYLQEVFEGHTENQPQDGVCATIPGNYGSTKFDPFDGSYLEICLCDPCLVEARERGHVLVGRRSRPVVLEGLHIGYEELGVPLVPWTKDTPHHGDVAELLFEDFDIGAEPLPKRFHIDPDALDAARRLIVRDGEW